MRITSTFLTFCLVLFFTSTAAFAQNQSQIINFLEENAEDILQFYHSSGGNYKDCSVTVKGEKATLTINYKGWIKKHKMRLKITFDSDGPLEVQVRSDTNMNKMNQEKKNNKTLDYLIEEWDDKYN